MFDKLHLLSQDVPEGGDGFKWRAHPYLRMAGAMPKGPAVFDWSARQRADLEALWRDPSTDGARERLARDLAAFCDRLGWTPDAGLLESAEQHGSDYLVTLSAVPPELYLLPWEVIEVGATGTYLSDYASTQVRYAMPGLAARPIQAEPALAGVLFAWSTAGGAVPHAEQAAAIRAAAEAGGVAFREIAEVDEGRLQAALAAGPPSVLHLLCHGAPGAEGEPPRVVWGASDNRSEISATRLARMLRPHDGALRLVVLSACGGGDGHGDAMFMTSLAQEVHKKGIPSVVASRYPLSVRGSRVMTRALYDKLLREAWSLERALRHTRQVLFHPDEDGEAHPGDAYGIQLYAHDLERFVSDNRIEAERPVLASYPFGTAARPVPASGPPAAELTLTMQDDPTMSEDELVDNLRRVSEDDSLTVAIPLRQGRQKCGLIVHTTVDGAHRLLGAWRSKVLQVTLGVILGEVIIKGIRPMLKGLLSSGAGKAGAVGGAVKLSAAAGRAASATAKVGAAAGRAGSATAKVGGAASKGGAAGKIGIAAGTGKLGGAAIGQGGAAAIGQGGAAVIGQAGVVVGQSAVGKIAATVVAIAGKVVSTKIVIAAVVSAVTVAGSAVVYRTEARQVGPTPAASHEMALRDPGRGSSVHTGASSGGGKTEAAKPVDDGPVSPPETTSPPPIAPSHPPIRSAQPPGIEAVARRSPTVAGTGQAAPGGSTATGREPSPGAAPAAPAGSPEAPAAPPAVAVPPPLLTASAAPGDGSGTVAPGPVSPTAASPGGPSSTLVDAPVAPPSAGSGSTAATAAHATPAAAASVDPTDGAIGPGSAATAPGTACGNGSVEAGEQCDDGNTRSGDGCSSTCTREAPTAPVTIDPNVLDAQRIGNTADVPLSKATKAAMLRDGMTSVKATVKLCVSAVGLVIDPRMIERTGYTEYDNNLLAAIYAWHFRPYQVDGVATPVCSTVEITYVLK